MFQFVIGPGILELIVVIVKIASPRITISIASVIWAHVRQVLVNDILLTPLNKSWIGWDVCSNIYGI